MKCLRISQCHLRLAKSRLAASISIGSACAGSPRQSLLCPPHLMASPPPTLRPTSAHSAIRARHNMTPLAAYDLKKLRGKQIVRRIAHTRRYETLPTGLRAIAALVVLRNKAIKPLLAAAQALKPSRGPQNPNPLDAHYEAIRISMKGIFDELGLAA